MINDDSLNPDIVLEFESITQFPLTTYFQNFDSFIKKDYNSIINYYSGNIDNLNSITFNNLKNLIDETQKLFADKDAVNDL